jgi:hypothetical protein
MVERYEDKNWSAAVALTGAIASALMLYLYEAGSGAFLFTAIGPFCAVALVLQAAWLVRLNVLLLPVSIAFSIAAWQLAAGQGTVVHPRELYAAASVGLALSSAAILVLPRTIHDRAQTVPLTNEHLQL